MQKRPPETISEIDIDAALSVLSRNDPVMRGIIVQVGAFTLEPKEDHFSSIIEHMIYQQVTGKAAGAIFKRITEAAGGPLSPERVDSLDDEELRNCGLSRQKISYVRDLTEKVLSGRIDIGALHLLSDRDVVERLTVVRGIGVWTAQMFLIFTLGRSDVLPLNDLGIRRAVMKRYNIRGVLTDSKLERLGRMWKPYRTVAVMYLWESENIKLPV